LRNDGRGHDWIVLLEAADGSGRSTIDAGGFGRLVTGCGTPVPTTLWSPDRYALQMSVQAPDSPAALSAAIARWRRALQLSELPEWDLVRAEVLTAAELELELREADRALDGVRVADPDPPPPAEIDPMEEALLRLALFDSVTGLPSRELFLEEVRRALEEPFRTPAVRAVLFAHVYVPEEAGPGDLPSDDLLAELACRLTGSVREDDTVARVGPSDFALLIEVPSPDHTDVVARRILDCIGQRSLNQHPQPLVASVGVAMTSAGGDADDLLQMAQLAMVAAARQPGDGHKRVPDGTGAAWHRTRTDNVPKLPGGPMS
jgi:diguanylate cyclase (GGDEF)-like protein